MVVKKRGSQFVVQSKAGKTLGTHKSRVAANRQLRAVEASKARSRKR